MGSGSSGGGGTTNTGSTTTASIAPQLQPLMTNAANEMQAAEQQYSLGGATTGGPVGSTNFFASNPMQIAPQTDLQTYAQNLSPSLVNAGSGALNQAQEYATLAPEVAGTMAPAVTADNPMMQATQAAFNQTMAPTIENQLSLAGLGDSSTLGNSLALADISQLVPTQQYEQSQEQGVIEGAASMLGQMTPQLTNIGNSQASNLNTAIGTMATQGAAQQSAAQAPLTSAYEDFLRQQALAEETLFVPFGDTTAGLVGSTTTGETASNPSGSGGLFK